MAVQKQELIRPVFNGSVCYMITNKLLSWLNIKFDYQCGRSWLQTTVIRLISQQDGNVR